MPKNIHWKFEPHFFFLNFFGDVACLIKPVWFLPAYLLASFASLFARNTGLLIVHIGSVSGQGNVKLSMNKCLKIGREDGKIITIFLLYLAKKAILYTKHNVMCKKKSELCLTDTCARTLLTGRWKISLPLFNKLSLRPLLFLLGILLKQILEWCFEQLTYRHSSILR